MALNPSPSPDTEVRTFAVGPLPKGYDRFIPPNVVESIRRVKAGEATEKDEGIDVLVPRLVRIAETVHLEIIEFSRRYMLNGALSEDMTEQSLRRLQESEVVKGFDEELSPKLVTDANNRIIEHILNNVRLALTEAMINHLKHGNIDPYLPVEGSYWIDEEGVLHIKSRDAGNGFDPDAVPDPSLPENLELECGRGVFLERVFMDYVKYGKEGTTGEKGTSLHMAKNLGGLDKKMLPADEGMEEEIAIDRYTRSEIQALLQDRRNEEEA